MRFLALVLSAVLTCSGVWSRPQAVFQPSLGGGANTLFSTTTTAKPQIPIIRHINRMNNDGSYTFGYESGDGSYRVETRGLDGLIKGRYGYVDEHGVRKEVDYMAGSATGYEPKGAGITVPPRPPPPQPQFQPPPTSQHEPQITTITRPQQSQFQPQRHSQPAPGPLPQPAQFDFASQAPIQSTQQFRRSQLQQHQSQGASPVEQFF